MNRIRLLLAGALLLASLVAVAQSAPAAHPAQNGGTPSVDEHLKLLTEKLNLSDEQQAKIRPGLEQMDAATRKIMHDDSLTREERLAKVRAARMAADKKLREILTDEQKKALDQLEQGHHPELHGDVHGPSSTQPHPPQL